MFDCFIPKSWRIRQNRKGVRPQIAMYSMERLESRTLLSASPLLLDVPGWVERADWNLDDVAESLQHDSAETGKHGKELKASGRWDQILMGEWYVPAANLLAYSVKTDPLELVEIADQTVFHIASAEKGVFSGENTVTVSKPTLLGLQTGEPITYSMTGLATRKGELRIVFSSLETGQPLVTGIGQMQRVEGSWRMTMQMATEATSSYVTHWAYMSKLPDGETPPVAELPPNNELLHNREYRWMEGTDWALTDSELFGPPTDDGETQPGAEFHIQGYRNGYFWGTSPSDASQRLTVVGSVTPRGNLFLSLTAADGTTVTRMGMLERGAGGRWTMQFRAYEETPAVGVAWRIHRH